MSEEKTVPSGPSVNELAADDLQGRLGTLFVEQLKRQPKLWHELTETEQHVALGRFEEEICDAIGDVVERLAALNHPRTVIGLEQVAFKAGGVKITATASKHAKAIHDLADLAGGSVVLVMVDANDFLKAGTFPQPDRDQGELGLEETSDEGFAVGDVVIFPRGDEREDTRATIVAFGAVEGVTAAELEFEIDGEEGTHSEVVALGELRHAGNDEPEEEPAEEGSA